MSHGPDHAGIDVLTLPECLEHLRTESVGRIAFVEAGQPVVLPVNFVYHRDHVVFRTARGDKLEAAWQKAPVAFQIDSFRPVQQKGWSVLVKGTAEVVEEENLIQELSSMPFQTWASSANRPYWVRIRPDEITGRRL